MLASSYAPAPGDPSAQPAASEAPLATDPVATTDPPATDPPTSTNPPDPTPVPADPTPVPADPTLGAADSTPPAATPTPGAGDSSLGAGVPTVTASPAPPDAAPIDPPIVAEPSPGPSAVPGAAGSPVPAATDAPPAPEATPVAADPGVPATPATDPAAVDPSAAEVPPAGAEVPPTAGLEAPIPSDLPDALPSPPIVDPIPSDVPVAAPAPATPSGSATPPTAQTTAARGPGPGSAPSEPGQPAHVPTAVAPVGHAVDVHQPASPARITPVTGLTLPDQLEPVVAGLVAGFAVTNRSPASVAVAIEFGRAGGGWAGAIVFNLWLSRQMRMRRMSQRQLAALSGVDHSTISRLLLHDRRPSLATATKLARALRQVEGETDAADYFERIPEETIFPSRRVEMALRADELLDDEEVRRLMSLYLEARRRRQAAISSTGRWSNGPPSAANRTGQARAAPDRRR